MNGRGPINRKKNIIGKADDESMKTRRAGRGEGPVGANGSAGPRKASQYSGQGTANRASAGAGRPMNRPKSEAGQATGNMNTHGAGMGGARPQQSRPSAGGFSGQSGNAQRPSFQASNANNASSGKRGFNPLILIVLAVLLLGGGGGLSGLFSGGSNNTTTTAPSNNTSYSSSTSSQTDVGSLLDSLLGGDEGTSTSTYNSSGAASNGGSFGSSYTGNSFSSFSSGNSFSGSAGSSALSGSGIGGAAGSLMSGYGSDILQQLLGGSWYSNQTGFGSTSSSAATTVATSSNNGRLDRSVASGSRDKYTQPLGNGRDTFTLMVYMCGADLESRSAMATRDLQEMAAAKYGDNVRVIVYTGGSTKWQNTAVSSRVNQVWRVQNGQLACLVSDAGTAAMTNPNTLSAFIQYCAKNFKASRYGLILWDHGSGSVSGYGYDEKNKSAGSMSLAGLNTALQSGGVKFDFVGYDACLMATVENALMTSKYADYLIASEETEPGIGWYYTNWLTDLGGNTSLPTLDIGQKIADDFVTQCNRQCRGQQTTLSLVDLAELENTVPARLSAFSQSISKLITEKQYKSVSNARNGSREFAQSSRIDQIDLTDLCNNLNTTESKALAKALTGAVKYNRYNNISDAYGLSIYFPYQRTSNVDKAVNTYAAIGMDESYAQCIRDFAGVQASGQAVTGGINSAMPSLFGLGGASTGSAASGDMLNDLLSAFLGGGYSSVSGLDDSNSSFLFGRSISDAELQSYLSENLLDASALTFTWDGERYAMELPPEQWSLVHGVDLNLFYDNGEGYVDLGLDNLFEFDEGGRLIADTSGTWLAINGQPVPYYHETSDYVSDDDWRITGYVPVLLNGERAELLIVFDAEHQTGFVAGARSVYDADVTETIAKAIDELTDGDTIVFLADLYDYDQNYIDSYEFGKTITVSGELTVGDVYLPDASKAMATYRITDIYNQAYWTPVIGQ